MLPVALKERLPLWTWARWPQKCTSFVKALSCEELVWKSISRLAASIIWHSGLRSGRGKVEGDVLRAREVGSGRCKAGSVDDFAPRALDDVMFGVETRDLGTNFLATCRALPLP